MNSNKEIIKIKDKHGFIYEVILDHSPHLGFTTAYYNNRVVGQVSLGRIYQPISDNDQEWEQYQERLSEWTDEIKTNMDSVCKEYFDAGRHKQ